MCEVGGSAGENTVLGKEGSLSGNIPNSEHAKKAGMGRRRSRDKVEGISDA